MRLLHSIYLMFNSLIIRQINCHVLIILQKAVLMEQTIFKIMIKQD